MSGEIVNPGAELDGVPEKHRDGLGEGRRAAHDGPVQALPDIEYQTEIPDARPGRDLVHVPGGTRHRRLEQGCGILGLVLDEVEERTLVIEIVDSLLPHRTGLPRALPHDGGVAGHAADHLDAGEQGGEPGLERHRDAERIGGDVPLPDELPIHLKALKGTRHRDG
mgnify:FL=1